MLSMNTFNDKVALVTGASRGIGQAIAMELGKRGAVIAGVDLTPEQAESVTNFCREQGIKGQGFAMDVSQLSSIEASMVEINKTFGAPAILVNNAGVTRDNLIMRMSQDEWDKVLFTNLNSVFWLSKICIRDMLKARWGRIISVASIVAFTGNAGQANYSSSKAAIVAFSKTLAKEVASRNITVNTVAPGFIETDMTRKLTDEQREYILRDVPLKRPGQPADVAKAVAFLASDDAAYITGTTIHVNGGMY
jgi:3-oxoacyl-[acyl-carrier protein] reductase